MVAIILATTPKPAEEGTPRGITWHSVPSSEFRLPQQPGAWLAESVELHVS